MQDLELGRAMPYWITFDCPAGCGDPILGWANVSKGTLHDRFLWRSSGVGRRRFESGVLGERKLGDQCRSCAGRAVERQCPAERLDSVF
jgi:hypothetical protein